MPNLSFPTLSRRSLLISAVAALFVGAGSGCSPKSGSGGEVGAGGKPVLRLAYFPNVTHAPALIGVQNGTFARALGDRATLKTLVFSAGPRAMEALLAGEVDIAYVGGAPAVNAFLRSEGALKVVAGAASGGAVVVARADSGIVKLSDLGGKRIGTPQKGGTQDIAARFYVTQTLKRTLSDTGGDTAIVPTEPPEIAQLFEQKQLDAAWVAEPWGARLIQDQGAKLIHDERDDWPNRRFATTVVVVRTAFLNAHPDEVSAFLEGHLDAIAALQAKPGEQIPAIVSEIKARTKREIPPELVKDSLKRIDFGADPIESSLKTQAERAFALGFLGKKQPDLSGLLDLSRLNDVLKKRGQPAIAAR